jgi:predicted permease
VAGRLFTAVAVTCLAFGIGTNTVIFSVFDAVFLRPLPFSDARRLVAIAGRHPETGRRVALSLDDSREIQRHAPSLETVGAYAGQTRTLNDGGEPERIGTQLVTANLFSALGIAPQRGRGFEPSDDVPAAAGVALISDAVWRRRYQADASAIGRLIRLDNAPYLIIGVMPPKFRFPSTSELWIPMTPALGAAGAASRGVSLVGRLATATSLDRANAELAGLVLPAQGSRSQRSSVARPYGTGNVGSEERLITGALMGATTLLLVMTCVNVANLLFARSAHRRREIALRTALGASRGRLVAQLLLESAILSLLAAAIAVPLAWYGIQWVHDAVPASDPLGPYYVDWALDVRTLAYAMATAIGTSVAFGLAPALDATGRRIVNPLRDTAGATTSRTQRRVHGALIVAQIALALVLLAGASIFVRTYAGLRGVDLGYDTAHLMTARVYLAGPQYDQAEARIRAVDAIASRLDRIGGAYAATVTDLVPLDDQGGSDGPAAVEGRTFEEGREPTLHYAGVAGHWPETFDVRVSIGRTFSDHELQSAAPVALVNATLAATFWPGQSPLGRRFRLADEPSAAWVSVIGVVPDIRTVKLDESRATPPTAYLPHRFVSTRNWGMVIRTRSAPASVMPEVRAAVHAVDPTLALFDVYSMEEVRWLSYWMYVMWGALFGAVGAISLLVATVGVYGVVFYTVAQRTREIGLRVALGARRAQVVGPLLKQVAWLTAAGLAIGVGAAVLITPVVGSLLIGVSPNAPMGYVVVAAILVAVSLGATWLPAWRASAVDPLVALRDQ